VTLWRISNHATLDGAGGLRASGRWHTRGVRIVYCAPNPASALLEILVHAEIAIEDIPVAFRWLEIDAPDSVAVETVDLGLLAPAWRGQPAATRRLGDQWLAASRSALLRVPSAIIPETWNVLINPLHHGAARIRVVRVHQQAVDRRLL
jgi:RES domain-containing protein